MELQQCYKAQSRLSEQLVVEVAEVRTSKSLIGEKEAVIDNLEQELSRARFALFFIRNSWTFWSWELIDESRSICCMNVWKFLRDSGMNALS